MFPSKLYTLMTYFRLHHVGKVMQCAKKVVSYSPGLGILLSGGWILFLTWPTGRWCLLRNSHNWRTVKSILHFKTFVGLVEMTSSLPKWQAVKMIFFAPCYVKKSILVLFFEDTTYWERLASKNTDYQWLDEKCT